MAPSHLRSRTSSWSLLSILAAALLTAAPASPLRAEDVVVRVGFCSSQTGVNASPSIAGRTGIQAMADWVNAGNVCLKKGRCLRVELVDKGDDGSSVATAAQLYQELVDDPSVDVLIGPYGSDATAAVHPIAEAGHKLLVAAFAATDSLFEDRARWRVQALPPASTYLDTLVTLLANAHPEDQPLPVVLPAENDEFGRAVNAFTRSHLEGHHVTAFSVQFDSAETPCASVPSGDRPCYYPDAGGAAGALESWVDDAFLPAAGSLDDAAVLSGGHNGDGVRLAKKLDAAGIHPRVLALTVAPGAPSFYTSVGAYARGIIGNTGWHEPQEIYSAANTPKHLEWFGPAHAEASSRIRALNGNTIPAYQAGSGGQAVLVLARAIQAADGIKSKEKVRQEIHRLRLQTCFGQYEVDEATGHQRIARMLMVQWHTPDDDASLAGPTLRVIAAPASLPSVTLSPFVYPKP